MSNDRNSVILFGLCEQDQELYASSFDIFRALVEDEIDVTMLHSDASTECLPQSVVAIVVSDLGNQQISILRQWSEDALLRDVPVFRHEASLPSQLLIVADRLETSARLHVDTALQLAEMRQLHEELQNTYVRLRDHLYDSSQLAPQVGFYNPVDPDAQIPANGIQVLEQRLPIDAQTCCGLSLHVEERVESLSDGMLTVEIFSPDDSSAPISWNLPYNALKAGWVTFAFEQNRTSIKKSAILKLIYKTRFGDGPRFSFGHYQVREDRATVIDGKAMQRSIALKVWTSMRGARLTTASQMWPAFLPDHKDICRIDVCIDKDLELTHMARPVVSFTFPVVVKDLDRRRILVHPLGQDPTVARMSEVCPPGTREIRAEVLTDHEMASPVEYALLPIQPTLQSLDIQSVTDLEIIWHLVMPTIKSSIIHRLAQPNDRNMDLLLLTRVPEGHTSDYCWAHFQAVSFLGRF